jgi:excisionase family DNA binding protein
MENNELLSTEELAELLGVHPATLATWRHEGRGPKFVKVGKVVRYRRGEIDAFLDSNTHTSTRS